MTEQEAGPNGGVEGADPGPGPGPRAGRLGSLLQDLLAAHGRQRTAELLGVSERTLSRATQQGGGAGDGEARLTEPLSRALQRYEDKHQDEYGHEAELPGAGALPLQTAYELAALRRRVDKLERLKRAVTEDLPEVREALTRLEASLEELRQHIGKAGQQVGQQVGQAGQTAAPEQGGDAGRPAGSVGASVPTASASMSASTGSRVRTTAVPHCRSPPPLPRAGHHGGGTGGGAVLRRGDGGRRRVASSEATA